MNEQSTKSRKKTTNSLPIIIPLGAVVWFSYAVFQEATLALPMNVSDGVVVLAMFLGGAIGFGVAHAIVAMAH